MALREGKQSFREEGIRIMKEERVAVTCRLNEKALKSLQILARKQKKPLNSMLIEGINEVLSKHGRKPVATEGVIGRPPSK